MGRVKGSHAAVAVPGTAFCVHVTPGARRAQLSGEGTSFRIAVTAPAEDGRANAAVAEALAEALGVAKTRLRLLRGAQGRDKIFRLE